MLETDAHRIAAAIEERVNTEAAIGPTVTARVETDRTAPNATLPGAGRPTFIRYRIQISDGTRVAMLNVDQAARLLADIEPDWDLDRLFDAIRSRGVRIEDSS
jgi:hypothetical protein